MVERLHLVEAENGAKHIPVTRHCHVQVIVALRRERVEVRGALHHAPESCCFQRRQEALQAKPDANRILQKDNFKLNEHNQTEKCVRTLKSMLVHWSDTVQSASFEKDTKIARVVVPTCVSRTASNGTQLHPRPPAAKLACLRWSVDREHYTNGGLPSKRRDGAPRQDANKITVQILEEGAFLPAVVQDPCPPSRLLILFGLSFLLRLPRWSPSLPVSRSSSSSSLFG